MQNTGVKNLKVCIKELERFIRDGNHIETGKTFKKFGDLRSREILANWLLCVVINFEQKSNQWRICTDPNGGDGILCDGRKNIAWPTEHILVSRSNKAAEDVEALILKHIKKKQDKGGAAYASGKILVVCLNKIGDGWCPNKIAHRLPQKLDFESVWVVGLDSVVDEQYNYNVTRLDSNGCPVWQVHIEKTFDDWKIKKIQ